jgi:hypothetical protein
MNTGKTHAIVVKTRTLKTRCLAMLVAAVVLGGVGVDGGWGQAKTYSWNLDGRAVSGSSGAFNGASNFVSEPDSRDPHVNLSGSAPTSCSSDSDCKTETKCPGNIHQSCIAMTCSCPSSSKSAGEPETSHSNPSREVSSSTSQPNDTPELSGGEQSLPGSELTQCPKGVCPKPPSNKPPEGDPPACSAPWDQCCRPVGEQPLFCFTAVRKPCKCSQ